MKEYELVTKNVGRVSRNFLARLRRLWQRGVGCSVSAGRNRAARRLIRLWSLRLNDGIRRGPCVRRPFQSSGHDWAFHRRAHPGQKYSPVYLAQLAGAIAGAGILYLIASGKIGFDVSAGFASNGYGEHSPGGYTLIAALVTEVVMTFFFLIVILGATDEQTPSTFAPIAIGLALTLIHLVSIPVTNTSVNPARSIGPAIFVGGWAISQLWLFVVAPIVGALLAGTAHRLLMTEHEAAELDPTLARTVTL